MRFQIKLMLGDTPITLSDDVSSMQEVFQKSSSMTEILPEQCHKCQGVKLALKHRRVKSKLGKLCSYYEISCKNLACRWVLPLSERQDGSGMYANEWKAPYEKSGAPSDAPPQEGPPPDSGNPRGW